MNLSENFLPSVFGVSVFVTSTHLINRGYKNRWCLGLKPMHNNKDPSVFGYSVFEATSVFEAATKKTDCGTETKSEGLISFVTGFFL